MGKANFWLKCVMGAPIMPGQFTPSFEIEKRPERGSCIINSVAARIVPRAF